MTHASRIALLAGPLIGLLVLGACAVAPPSGPTIAAMPGQGKSFEAFQQDDFACRQFADQRIGFASPAQAATQSAVGSAALGTVVGAAAGALIGAAAGNPGAGAAIGAGSGLLVGAAGGAGAAQYSGAAVQQQYDVGYAQCMAAKGNSVPPVPAGFAAAPGFGTGFAAPAIVAAPTITVVGGGWGWGPGWGWGGGWGWGRPWGWGGGWGWGAPRWGWGPRWGWRHW